MEEIKDKIKSEIDNIKEEKDKLDQVTQKSAELQEEEKKIKEELETIQDTNSGFYQDMKAELDAKHHEFIMADNDRRQQEKEFESLVQKKKEEIRKELADKKKYLDDNRKVNLEDLKKIDVEKLKREKAKLEKEIELNNVTKEEFEKKTDSEKREIREAKGNYLNNKKRLAKINPTIQLIDTLEGKSPLDRFKELDELDKDIENNFNKDNLDGLLDRMSNKSNEDLLNEMVSGREKREEERYYEDVKSALEETEKREKQEKEQEEKLEKMEQDELLKDMIEGREKREEERYREDIKSGLEETKKRQLREEMGKGMTEEKGTKKEQTTQNSKKVEPFAITIGREGTINRHGKEYEVSARDIKYGQGLNLLEDDDLKDYLKKQVRIKDGKLDFMKDLVREGLVDMTVIHAIYSTDMSKREKSDALNAYVAKIQYAKANVKGEEHFDIIYDMKDLSKTNFFGRIFKQEVNTDEKLGIYNNAIKAERYGIGRIRGEYKTSKLEAFFNRITGREETAKFPIYKAEDVYEVASMYNDMAYDKDGNKLKKKEVKKSFRKALKADAQLEEDDKNKLSDEQKIELESLVKEHQNPIKPEETQQDQDERE